MNKELLKIKKECQNIIKDKTKLSNYLSTTRLILFLIIIIVLFYSLSSTNYPGLIITLLLIISFIIVITIHERLSKLLKKQDFYLKTITKYENRTNELWKEEKTDYIENLPNFASDLDIINNNSLLKYINFTTSLGCKNLLIDSLSLKNKITKKEILSNQSSIKELSNNPRFILEFQYILNNIDNIKETDYKNHFYFFENKKVITKIPLIISSILSILAIIIGILSLLNIIPAIFFLLIFIIQITSSFIYKMRHQEILSTIDKSSKIYSNLNPIYKYISNEDFQSKKNNSIKLSITKGEKILKEINIISDLNSLRYNFITNIIFSVFASLNYIIIYKYNKLLNNKISDFKESIKSLEELDKLISLSTIGIVKVNKTLPNIINDLSLDLTNISHPLIKEESCITNNFKCQKDINIITGSNMSGKTSFMKTIAINLVLAYNGSYVNAFTFNCPILNIFTSINVKDDISNGISTFYGELKRIKDILDFSNKNSSPIIVFIDEIFKGTNYNDRILGAKEVVKKLSELNCIVFLTTHDFELCEINNKEIKNYSFSESYKNNKIIFDYTIREGKCKTTNAKYLMKEMGILK